MSDFTFFWRNRSVFSNWYPSRFTHNGITYTRGEQYMMYQKAILFGDIGIAAAILGTDDPAKQKALGRAVSNYDDVVWGGRRVDIMVDGLYEKFNQNPRLKKALMDTGNSIMVEASPYDRIWGIGLEEGDPDAKDPAKWRGQNLLGFVLMKVRARIRGADLGVLIEGVECDERTNSKTC